jgi:heat-inducible transcriptional repressor
VPADHGYRYYVNSLVEEQLSPEEQRLVRHLFHQVEMDLDEWVKLAASLLAQLSHNAAVVVPPRAVRSRIKRLHLVAVQDSVALLVMILEEARLRQQLVSFEEEITQEDLDLIANKLNSEYVGLTRNRIASKGVELTPQEKTVIQVAMAVMETEDEQGYGEPYLEGLRHLLGQPEFLSGAKMLSIVGLLEKKGLVSSMLAQGRYDQVKVVIGEENAQDELRDLSVVVSAYGVPDEFSGAVGVVGPRRMQYSRTISAVRLLASVLGDLAAELHGTNVTGNSK